MADYCEDEREVQKKQEPVRLCSDELVLQRNEELQREFAHANREGKASLNRCKLIIVGDERAGKTSLRKHLMAEKMSTEEASTVGIETFDVETFDVDEKWQKRKSKYDDFDRTIAWCVLGRLGHSVEKSVKTDILLESPVLPSTYLMMMILPLTILKDECRLGFTVLFMIILVTVTLDRRTRNIILLHNLAGAATMSCFGTMTFLSGTYWDPLGTHKPTNFNLFLFYGTSFITGFSWHYGGMTGVTVAQSMMIVPGQMSLMNFLSDFKVEWLHIDVHSTYFRVMTTWCVGAILGFGFSQALLFSDARRKGRDFAASALIVLSMILIQGFTPRHKDLDIILVSVPVGILLHVGAVAGRECRLIWDFGLLFRRLFAIICGFLIGKLHNFTRPTLWSIPWALPFLSLEVYTLFELWRGRQVGNVPAAEVLHTLKEMEQGREKSPTMFTIMDFAGQKIYYDMHHVFLAQRAIYLVVVNLRDAIMNSKEQYERVLFWMNRIHMHINISGESATGSSDNTGNARVPIFLVGTHRHSICDIKDAEERVEKFSIFITESIQRSQTLRNSLIFNNSDGTVLFTVENSANIKKDTGAVVLRQSIRRVLAETDFLQEKHHIKWLKVVKICQAIRSEGRKLIDTASVYKHIQETYPGEFNLSDIETSLKVANNSGYLIYNECSELRDYVIVDQCYLIDIMKEFISPQKRSLLRLPCHWDLLKKEAIAHWDLMVDVFKCKDIDVEPTLQYLKHLDLIYELPSASSSAPKGGARVFLIPSQLQKCEVYPISSDTTEPKIFHFDLKDVPVDELYTRLLCRILNHQESDIYDGFLQTSKVYKNLALIQEPGMYTYSLEIVSPTGPHQHLLRLKIWPIHGYNEYLLFVKLAEIVAFIVQRDFPYVRYIAGPRCPNTYCDTMKSPNYVHVLPLIDSKVKKRAPGETIYIACGREHYRFILPTGEHQKQKERAGCTEEQELSTEMTLEEMFYQMEPSLNIDRLVASVFPPKLARSLALELDPVNWEHNDWRHLAQVIGLRPEIIRWMEATNCYRSQSPTLRLLSVIAGVHKGHSLVKLKEYLTEMEYQFCLNLIEEHFSEAKAELE